MKLLKPGVLIVTQQGLGLFSDALPDPRNPSPMSSTVEHNTMGIVVTHVYIRDAYFQHQIYVVFSTMAGWLRFPSHSFTLDYLKVIT